MCQAVSPPRRGLPAIARAQRAARVASGLELDPQFDAAVRAAVRADVDRQQPAQHVGVDACAVDVDGLLVVLPEIGLDERVDPVGAVEPGRLGTIEPHQHFGRARVRGLAAEETRAAAVEGRLVGELHARLGIRCEFVNIGGGIGIPYRPEQRPVDLAQVSAGIRAAYNELIAARGLGPLALLMECGRVITGPYGYLVARVRHLKRGYKQFAGLDACMANLMRPAMYGAYHHITVLGFATVQKI